MGLTADRQEEGLWIGDWRQRGITKSVVTNHCSNNSGRKCAKISASEWGQKWDYRGLKTVSQQGTHSCLRKSLEWRNQLSQATSSDPADGGVHWGHAPRTRRQRKTRFLLGHVPAEEG